MLKKNYYITFYLTILVFMAFTFAIINSNIANAASVGWGWSETYAEGGFDFNTWNTEEANSNQTIAESTANIEGTYDISTGEDGYFSAESYAKTDLTDKNRYKLHTYGFANADAGGGAFSYGYSQTDAGVFDTYTVESGNDVTLGFNVRISGDLYAEDLGGSAYSSIEFMIGDTQYGGERYNTFQELYSGSHTWNFTYTHEISGLSTGSEIPLYFTLLFKVEAEALDWYSEAWSDFLNSAEITYYVNGGTITAASGHTAVPIPPSALLFVSGLVAIMARKFRYHS